MTQMLHFYSMSPIILVASKYNFNLPIGAATEGRMMLKHVDLAMPE